MTAPIRIVVAEPDVPTAGIIRDAIEQSERLELVTLIDDPDTLLATVGPARADAVVVDVTSVRRDVAAVVRELLAISPELCVIIVGADLPPGTVARAVSAGARGFLLRPFEPLDLLATIEEAHTNLAELRRLQQGDRPTVVEPNRGTVIAIYSPKGGVGCTTIASNLSIALASRTKRPVALLDLDLQFGDIGVSLDLRSANSMYDLVAHADKVDASLIDEVFVRHSSGVRAVLAPDTLAQVESVDPQQIAHVIGLLRSHFAYIVCDLWSSFDELTLAVMRVADRRILVTTPELPALRSVRRILAVSPAISDERTHVVVNRHPGKVGVSLADIQRSLGRTILAGIPSEGIGVTQAINQGVSMFDPRARARLSRHYLRLADLVLRDLGHLATPAAAPRARISWPARSDRKGSA